MGTLRPAWQGSHRRSRASCSGGLSNICAEAARAAPGVGVADHRCPALAGDARRRDLTEVTAVYDNYVNALETGSVEALRAYARDMSERIVRRGVETDEVLGTVLLLRDVLARALFLRHQGDPELLGRVLDVYEPAANRIAVTVGVSFVEERGARDSRAAGCDP